MTGEDESWLLREPCFEGGTCITMAHASRGRLLRAEKALPLRLHRPDKAGVMLEPGLKGDLGGSRMWVYCRIDLCVVGLEVRIVDPVKLG